MVSGFAVAIGGALKLGVVQQDGDLILAQFGIKFDHFVAKTGPDAHGGEGVFWGKRACTPVRD
jgi:hypothetical protein